MSRPSYEVINRSVRKIYKSVSCTLRRVEDKDVIDWLKRDDTPTATQILRANVHEAIAEEQASKKG